MLSLYLDVGLVWAGVCIGHEIGKHPKATSARLLWVAAVNCALWPATMVVALLGAK